MRKKLKRYFLFTLIMLILLILLSGCRKRRENPIAETQPENTTERKVVVRDVLDLMEQQKWNVVNIKFDWKQSESEYIHGEIAWEKTSDEKGILDISADFSMNNIKSEQMRHFTTVYYDKDIFYVNIRDIMDYIVRVDEQYIAITGFFQKLGEYVQITSQDLAKILDQKEMRQEEILLLRFFNQDGEEKTKQVQEIVEILEDFLVEFEEKSRMPEVTEDCVVFKIDEVCFPKVKDLILSMDTEKYYEKIICTGSNKELGKEFAGGYVNKIKKWETDFFSIWEQIKSWNGNMMFGVSAKNVPYFCWEYEVQDSGEAGQIQIEFNDMDFRDFSYPQNDVSFAEFIKIFERVQKFLGGLS